MQLGKAGVCTVRAALSLLGTVELSFHSGELLRCMYRPGRVDSWKWGGVVTGTLTWPEKKTDRSSVSRTEVALGGRDRKLGGEQEVEDSACP